MYIDQTSGVECFRIVTTDKMYEMLRKNECAINCGFTYFVEFEVWDINIFLRTVNDN